MLRWMHEHQALLWSLGGASVALFIASLIAIPIIVAPVACGFGWTSRI